MTPPAPRTTPVLPRILGRLQLFALAFGCIVGSGWVVVLGDWLSAAAPGGAVVGFLAGGTVMLAICGGYAELVARIPVAGGDFEFARRIFGRRIAFLVGWFSTLSLLAVASFEGIALGWILRVLLPGIRGPVLYHLFDVDTTADDLVIGIGGALVLGWINFHGVKGAARVQTVVTFGFIGLAAIVIICGLALGSPQNAAPLFSPNKAQPWWIGAMWIFASTPFFLNGFQSVTQLVEERAGNVRFATIAWAMCAAVAAACTFYCGLILAAATAVPWVTLLGRELPAAAAVESLLPGGLLSRLVLLAAVLSVIKMWNGVMLWASHLLMAQARAQFLPAALSRVHPKFGSPFVAVTVVTVVNIGGVLLGRGVLVPLLNMTSMCVGTTMILSLVAALRLRAMPTWTSAPYATPGGRPTLIFGLVGAIAMAAFAMADPVLRARGGLPAEWVLLVGWAVLGALAWFFYARHHAVAGPAV